MDIKDLIVRYGLVFPRRFYPKEKLRFLRGLAQEFYNAGMKVDIKEASKNQRKAYNFYAGDIGGTGLTISAGYDTPPKTFGLIRHKVFNPKGDMAEFLLSILIPYALIIVLAALLSQFMLMPVWLDNTFNFLDILAVIPLMILLFLLVLFRNGIGNKPNLIRNSAALIACVKLVEGLKPKDRNKVSIAFTDYGCISHYGDVLLKEILAEDAVRRTVVFLDCVGGEGDVIVLYSKPCAGYIEKVKTAAADKAVFYEMGERDLRYYRLFEKSIVLTSGRIDNGVVRVGKVNTSKDNDLDEGNLDAVIIILRELVRNYTDA